MKQRQDFIDHDEPLTDEQSRLAGQHRALARWYAGRVKRLWLTKAHPDDLLGAAQMGLIRAARSYDESSGFKFSTWAMWHMRHMMNVDVARARLICIPNNMMAGTYTPRTEKGRRLSRIALRLRKVNNVRRNGVTLAGVHVLPCREVNPMRAAMDSERALIVSAAVDQLKPRWADLIRRCVITKEITVSEWCRREGVTKQNGEQIKKRALKRLRVILERKGVTSVYG